MRRDNLRVWVVFGLAIAAVVWLVGRPNDSDLPLSPWSSGQQGTAALAELIEDHADTTRLEAFEPAALDSGVIVLLVDRLSDEQTDAVQAWVDDGGQLIVADPSSSFAPGFRSTTSAALQASGCAIAEIDGLTISAPPLGLTEPWHSDTACFLSGDLAFLTARDSGAGEIVTLASSVTLINMNLGEADNAAVIGRLILRDDPESVTIMRTSTTGVPGEADLFDLVPTPVRWFWVQLGVAALIAMWAVGRRFGKVVTEPAVVELPGSLAVRATADLYRRADGRSAAAQKLQRSAFEHLRRSLHMPPSSDPATVVTEAQVRYGLPDEVAVAVGEVPPLLSDDDLVRYVERLDAVGDYLPSGAGRLP